MNRKFGLDAVRAGAICLVLVSHLVRPLDFLGLYGVELFFALSGFLIGGILYRRLVACERWSFGEVKSFWLRRWWRTLPNYYLFFAVSILFDHYTGNLPSPAGVLPFFVFAQDLFDARSGFYGVSWSLCIEEWFYLFFPLCILGFCALRCSKRIAFGATTILFLVAPLLLRERLHGSVDPLEIRKLTIPRLDAIFYGVAVAFVTARYRFSGVHRTALLVVALAGLAAVFGFQSRCAHRHDLLPFYRAAFVVLPASFSLMLPFLAGVENPAHRYRLITRPVTALSLWSYSIYLSHIPILFSVYALFGSTRDHVAINVLSKFVAVAVCVWVSGLIYQYFELRLMEKRPAEGHST